MRDALEGPLVVEAFAGAVYPALTPGWPKRSEIKKMDLEELQHAWQAFVAPRLRRVIALEEAKRLREKERLERARAEGKYR